MSWVKASLKRIINKMNIENIVEISVGITIAILGIAYPIMIDKISTIGEKYSSNYLSEIFKTEKPQILFRTSLIITLITFFFIIFQIEPLFQCNLVFFDFIVNNSSKLLVFISSTFLVIVFFNWLSIVAKYNGKQTDLISYIIDKYKKNRSNLKDKENYYLKTINEFSYYSINQQDEHIQNTLVDFYSEEFLILRNNHNTENAITYPADLYYLVYKIIFEIINSNNYKLQILEHRAVSGLWLLGEDFKQITISDETYSWLWRNLNLIVKNDSFVEMYWETACQYYNFKLEKIYGSNYVSETSTFDNDDEIDKRDIERKRFIEFNIAFGGLILFNKRYHSMLNIFSFTQSQPPKYVLLSENMEEIFFWFEEFKNEFSSFRKYSQPIEFKYYFVGLNNLGNRKQVVYWICMYITLLFVRQFKLHSYYTSDKFINQPSLPTKLYKLNNWLENLELFGTCLNEIISNIELMEILEFDINKKTDYMDFIFKLKENIKSRINETKNNAKLITEKINVFNNSTNEMLEKAFDLFASIQNQNDFSENVDNIVTSFQGYQTLFPKGAFTDDTPHMNYDTIISQHVIRQIVNRYIPNSFLNSKTKKYIFNKENIIEAIKKLNINKVDFLIIGFNISYQYMEALKEFKEQMVNLPATDIIDNIFILNKRDLPLFKNIPLKENEIKNDKLLLVNEKYKIYTSVLDLNESENKINKETWENNEDVLNKKVQVSIKFITNIFWREERKIVQINFYSEFKEQGIENKIGDIEPFN